MPKLSEEQLASRSTSIGSSESAQALGLLHDRTAYDLWLEKRGEKERGETTEQQEVGHLLEPTVARLYEAKNGAVVASSQETYQHPELPWLTATPDFKVMAPAIPRVILEAKIRNPFMRREFGEQGTDELPMSILVQALHQLAVCHLLWKVERIDVAVLFGDWKYEEWRVNYDQAAVDRLIGRVGEFWACVESGTPPAPQSLKDVRRMFSRDVGRTVEASAPVQQSVEMLRSVKSKVEELKEMEETLLLQIQTHMGDASTLLTPDGQIAATWKRSKDSQRVDLDKLRSEYADVYQRCLKVQEGSRRFLLK